MVGAAQSNISKWLRDRTAIAIQAGIDKRSKLLKTDKQKARYPELDAKILEEVVARRKRGLRVSFLICVGLFMISHFFCCIFQVSRLFVAIRSRQLFPLTYPASPHRFLASKGYVSRFCDRSGLSVRRKTNNKAETVAQRLPRCLAWMEQFRTMLSQETVGEFFDQTFGRFLLKARVNVDQVPFPFIVEQTKTLETTGAKAVHIKEALSGSLSKRQATLQVAFSPDKNVQPRLAIIFRGTGQRISQVEKASWDPRVDTYFNLKAWADRDFSVAWVNRTLREYVTRIRSQDPTLADAPLLLLCDNLDSQVFPDFKAACSRLNVLVWNFPPGVTDLVQPVDSGLGREIKRTVATLFASWLEDPDNLAKWESNKLSASNRRVLMSVWAADAFATVIQRCKIHRYWEKTGCAMTINGTGDSLIRPEGAPDDFKLSPAPPLPAPRVRDFRVESDDMDVDVPLQAVAAAAAEESEEKKDEHAEEEEDDDDDDDDEDLFDDATGGESDEELDDPSFSTLESCLTLDSAAEPDIEPVAAPPVIHKSLVGQVILFRWKHFGWTRAKIKQFYTGKRATTRKGERNVEIVCEKETHDLLLQEPLHLLVENNAASQRGVPGNWFLTRKVPKQAQE